MKTLSTLLLFILNSLILPAQNEKATYKLVADSLELNYNAENFEAIFSSFSPEMQKALPLEKTKDFF